MTIPWYEQEENKDQLTIFGRAIQGAFPYEVILESDPARCHGGYCSFNAKQIIVNPTLFDTSEKEQYELTQALLVHEAGHKRHTTPAMLSVIIREISNILEDERIERRMCEEFVGIRWLIHKLAAKFYEEAKPINFNSDVSDEVISYFLQLRWAKRIGQPVKGTLSERNQILWKKVEPFVYESWDAMDSIIVNCNALKIANILSVNKYK